jgi:hypothetical protein
MLLPVGAPIDAVPALAEAPPQACFYSGRMQQTSALKSKAWKPENPESGTS